MAEFYNSICRIVKGNRLGQDATYYAVILPRAIIPPNIRGVALSQTSNCRVSLKSKYCTSLRFPEWA